MHVSSVDGGFLFPPSRVDGGVGGILARILSAGICRAGAHVWRFFPQPGLDVVYRLKERGSVVQITEEVRMRICAYHGTSNDATCRSKSGEGCDAINGKSWSAEHLAPDGDGQCAKDAAGNLRKDEKGR